MSTNPVFSALTRVIRGYTVLGRAALVPALAAAATGCYRYAPVAVGELQEGQTVRMQLSAVAVDRVRQRGTDDSRLLEGFGVSGTLRRLASDSLFVTVESSLLDAGARARTVRRDVPLLRSDVQLASLRRLDKKRTTWASVVLGAAAVGSVAIALQRGGRSGGTTPNPQGPPETRIPFSLAWLIR